MKTNKSRKVKEGDILFSVDPQKLVIAQTDVMEIKNGHCTISVKNISYTEEQLIPTDSFPTECNGLLFFRTQDDAEEFIKTQIGI